MWLTRNAMLFHIEKQINKRKANFTFHSVVRSSNGTISKIKNNPAFCSNVLSVKKSCVTATKLQFCNNAVNVSQQSVGAEVIDYNVLSKTKDSFMDNELEILNEEVFKLPRKVDPSTEISHFGPDLSPSYNLAKYANESHTIKELIKLGVELYRIEGNVELMEFLLTRDFDKDIAPYITFLHDCGVPADFLGQFISKNPLIFQEDMDDLHTRIRYLRFHQFSKNMILTLLCKHPRWLSFNTKHIDFRLGYFQNTFGLNGHQVKLLSVKKPKLITDKMRSIREHTFAVKEEMGFDNKETKMLLLRLPNLWIKSRKNIVDTFDYAHNEMKLSHADILTEPNILLCRKSRLEQRHMFLVKLKRAQYDPTKPLYISPKTLVSGTDLDFCKNVAKVNIETYNLYLKTF